MVFKVLEGTTKEMSVDGKDQTLRHSVIQGSGRWVGTTKDQEGLDSEEAAKQISFPSPCGKLGEHLLHFFLFFCSLYGMLYYLNISVMIKNEAKSLHINHIWIYLAQCLIFAMLIHLAAYILKLGWFSDKPIHNSHHVLFCFYFYIFFSNITSSLEGIYLYKFTFSHLSNFILVLCNTANC